MPAIPNPYLNRVSVPTPPVHVDLRPLELRIERLKAALAIVVGILACFIAAAAFWPAGQPTHPMRLVDEQPVSRLVWHESDYTTE